MEYVCGLTEEVDEMELPPGFRFHPTDEELITHYLSRKVLDNSFRARVIGEVDLNKVEPWDLPGRAKMGEREWYFFCVRDRKYPTGMRTNRATGAGYWKATGKDKEIFRAKTLVGMKKTLVFYQGRAPKGSKSNWVMHEYRLEGKCPIYSLPKTAKNEWVICRIFHKSSDGKKIHSSDISTISGYKNEPRDPNLPLLVDFSSQMVQKTSIAGDTSDISCLSAPLEDEKIGKESVYSSDNNHFLPKSLFPDLSSQFLLNNGNFQYFDSTLDQDQSILKLLLQNNELDTMKYPNTEFSPETTGFSADIVSNHEMCQRTRFEDQLEPDSGRVDLDCLWNY